MQRHKEMLRKKRSGRLYDPDTHIPEERAVQVLQTSQGNDEGETVSDRQEIHGGLIMTREDCMKEMMISLLIGNLITLIIFSALHAVFSPLEVVCFWVGTWFVATYAVWTVIDILDRKKA